MKIVIVGAGLAGAICVYLLRKKYPLAEIIVYEKNEIGGLMVNMKVNGMTVQKYGPHVFHTSNNDVRDLMLEIFDKYNIEWETYYLQVYASVNNKIITLPYSKLTGLNHDEYYSQIIEPYTLKQWGKINNDAINRLHELKYFTTHYHTPETFSCIFDHTTFFNQIFSSATIIHKELTEHDLANMNADIKIYTGYREDCQFKYTKFVHELLNDDLHCLQMNVPDINVEYTRIMDYCYLSNKPIQTDLHPICKEVPLHVKEPSSCEEPPLQELGSLQEPPLREPVSANEFANSYKIITYPIGEVVRDYEGIVYLGRFGVHKYLDMECVVNDVLQWFKQQQLNR